MKTFSLTLFVLTLAWPSSGRAVRIKELTSVHGARSNQLMGYGIVVGLNGTGDDRQVGFTIQSVTGMLSRMGLRVDPSSLTLKNVAAVTVTANLPAFVKTGTRVNVRVASIGNAKSLKGGILLATPLKAFNRKVYMVAQGAVVIGSKAGRSSRGTVLTTGMVIGGGLVEKEVPVKLERQGEISLSLKRPDFTTSSRIAREINNLFSQNIALARSSGAVRVIVPRCYRGGRIVNFIASIEGIDVIPDNTAKVVINSKTGTVVIGPGVTITTCAISHGGISLTVAPKGNPKLAKPGLHYVGGHTLGDVVEILNSLGVSPKDLAAIFRMLKQAGALHGELEVQ